MSASPPPLAPSLPSSPLPSPLLPLLSHSPTQQTPLKYLSTNAKASAMPLQCRHLNRKRGTSKIRNKHTSTRACNISFATLNEFMAAKILYAPKQYAVFIWSETSVSFWKICSSLKLFVIKKTFASFWSFVKAIYFYEDCFLFILDIYSFSRHIFLYFLGYYFSFF